MERVGGSSFLLGSKARAKKADGACNVAEMVAAHCACVR